MDELEDLRQNGSSIHITRNNFVIQGLELGAHFNDILAGALPSSLACDFVHESTHHWCFTLTVGYAMAILQHRARLTLMMNPNADTNINQMLAEQVLLESMRAALDPLTEGLALFAELDVQPGTLTSLPVLNWLALMFLRSKIVLRPSASDAEVLEAGRTIDAAVKQLLDANRKGDVGHLKRENLLSQPLALRERGHYLLGYMLMKRILRRLRLQLGSLAETDLVLEWVMRFFFDDSRLVLMLLDKNRAARAGEIMARIESRIDTLFSDKASDWFSTFARDRAALTTTKDSDELASLTAVVIGLEPSDAIAARKVLFESHRRMLDSPGIDEDDRTAAHWAITMRHMTSLGQLNGVSEVFPNGSIKFSHPLALLLEQGLGGREPGAGSGSFVQFFSGHYGSCTLVSRKTEAVSIHAAASPSKDIDRFSITPLTLYPAFDARLRQLDGWFQSALQTISPGLAKAVRDQTRANLERIYRRAALGERAIPRHHDLVQVMNEAGFFGLLKFDLECLRDLVALGLPGEQVPSERIAVLKALGEALEFPLVEELEERVVACV